MQNNVTSYDDIYAYIENQLNQGDIDLATAFYTALGRERASVFNSRSNASTIPSTQGSARYIVRYDKNIDEEVTNMPAQQTKIHGTDLILTDTKPARTGYDFLGWSTLPGEQPIAYQAGGTYSIDANITLYAQWKLRTYTVGYNANGGIGAPAAQTKIWGVDLKLSDVRPVRTGYDFLGWSEWIDNTTPDYYKPDNMIYKINDHATLYAIWQRNTFTIEYNANGGTGAPGSQTKVYGDDNFTLSTDIPTRNGYTFKGWATTSNATNAQYQPGAKYTANADIKLYAVWELSTYTLTYDFKGGTGSPASQTWKYGEQLQINPIKPTREGYTFGGWSLSEDASVYNYYNGQLIPADELPTGNMTIYGIWKSNEYTITYNANGGSGAPSQQTKTHGVNITLSSTKPIRTGYSFQGWATTSNATSAEYSAGGTYTANGDKTLYAVWEANTYILTYDFKGGTGSPASQTWKYGEQLQISSIEPKKDGYSFGGWSLSTDASVYNYYKGQVIPANELPTGNMTIYAIWNLNKYTITYNANGGSGAPSQQTKTHGVTLTIPTTTPTRTGYTFQGWATTANATSAQYQAGGTYAEEGTKTLYAVWKKDLPSTNYTKPYLPEGFEYEEGDLNTGLVITDKLENEYVWIEVPRTNEVYSTAGLDITSFGTTEYTKIEKDLRTYVGSSYVYTDTCLQKGNPTGLKKDEYEDLKRKMLKSIYQNGGFYIGRYETGTFTPRNSNVGTTGYTAVIQANAYPYNYVYPSEALVLARNMQSGQYTSSLMFGVQWDLILKYLENKGVPRYDIYSDSKNWGNHSGVLLKTGSNQKYCKQGVYDLAGSLMELTLERNNYLNIVNCVARGGFFDYPADARPASDRYGVDNSTGYVFLGFRVTIF